MSWLSVIGLLSQGTFFVGGWFFFFRVPCGNSGGISKNQKDCINIRCLLRYRVNQGSERSASTKHGMQGDR